MVQYSSSALRPPATCASYAVPPSQNSAPVIDFDCLFTYDIRRKAKRWHDGSLRFHTFNHRVMVYDGERNLVGDTHERNSVQSGDEFSLQKSGALIEVGELKGATQTDLTELLKKRGNATSHPPRELASAGQQPVQQQSPYSIDSRRVEFQRESEQRRQASRPRTEDEHTPLWQVLKRSTAAPRPNIAARSPLTPRPAPDSRTKTISSSKAKKRGPVPSDSQPRLNVKELIEIPSDSDNSEPKAPAAQDRGQENRRPTRADGWFQKPGHTYIDQAAKQHPPTPPSAANSNATNAAAQPTNSRRPEHTLANSAKSRSPPPKQPGSAVQNFQRPKARTRPSPLRARPPSPPSSPPVSTTSPIVQPRPPNNIDLTDPAQQSKHVARPREETERPVKQLRLQAQASRPMLFCQSRPQAAAVQRQPIPPQPTGVVNHDASDFEDLSSDEDDDASPAPFAVPNQAAEKPSSPKSNEPLPATTEETFERLEEDPPDYSQLDAQLLASPAKAPTPPRQAPTRPSPPPSPRHASPPVRLAPPSKPSPAPALAPPPVQHTSPPRLKPTTTDPPPPPPESPTPPITDQAVSAAPIQGHTVPPIQAPPLISTFAPSRAPQRRTISLHNPQRPSNPANPPFKTAVITRSMSDTASSAHGSNVGGAGEGGGDGSERRQRKEKGPWTIEAFDLFGVVSWPDRGK